MTPPHFPWNFFSGNIFVKQRKYGQHIIPAMAAEVFIIPYRQPELLGSRSWGFIPTPHVFNPTKKHKRDTRTSEVVKEWMCVRMRHNVALVNNDTHWKWKVRMSYVNGNAWIGRFSWILDLIRDQCSNCPWQPFCLWIHALTWWPLFDRFLTTPYLQIRGIPSPFPHRSPGLHVKMQHCDGMLAFKSYSQPLDTLMSWEIVTRYFL